MSEDIPKEIKASTEVTPKDTPKKKKEITMSGKGDKPRPYSTSQEEYARKWDKAFGKQKCIICDGDEDIQDMTMDQIHRTGGMYNGDCCKKCRDFIDGLLDNKCVKSHIPNEETLKSMEKTEKDNADKILQRVAEDAAESVYIPKGRDIKEIAKGITLLSDNTLEMTIEKIKDN